MNNLDQLKEQTEAALQRALVDPIHGNRAEVARLLDLVAEETGPVREDIWPSDEVHVEDLVNHPDHYNQAGIECIDAIEAVYVGHIIRYIWRYEAKGGAQDVHKAQWYMNRLVAYLDKIEAEWTDWEERYAE